MNRHWFLFDNFFDDFLFFYDDRLVMMMNILHLCVRMFVMRFPDRHMDHNLLLMIAANRKENTIANSRIIVIVIIIIIFTYPSDVAIDRKTINKMASN